MDFLKKNKLVGVLVIVVVIAGIYYGFFNGEKGAIVTSSAEPSSTSEATFLGFAGELETVTFDSTIFSDPRFTNLKDIHTTVVDEAAGRRDPFGPLTGAAALP